MKTIAKLLITSLALLVVAEFVPGFFVENFYIAVIIALAFGVISLFIKPILTLLTLPLHLITFGFFAFVINALLLWFISTFIAGFVIESFSVALLGALIIALISHIGGKFIEALD